MKNFTINNLLIAVIALFSGANVLAAEQVCNQFDYFYADITAPGGVTQTDIYSVSFVGNDAILTAISEDIPYGAHIAYNDIERLLYVVNEDDGSIQTYDPILDEWSLVFAPSMILNHITGASISPDGKLLMGNQSDNVIYQANFSTDPYTVTVYEPDNNISGGDLVFTNTGLFLASKPSGYFYVVLPGMPNMLLDQVDGNVTGLAKAEDGETVMLSAVGNTSFLQYNIDMGGAAVTQINEFNALLNGEPFTLGNGDMASGCSSSQLIIEECTDFRYYYIGSGTPGVATGTVFQGEIVGTDFVLTELFNAGNKGHIANNEITGDIYVVNQNGSNVKTFDVNGNHLHTVSVSGLGNNAVAAVWHKLDGKLYVGNSNSKKVYTLNPVTGVATLYADNLPVSGGDLISTDNGELRLVERNNSGLSKVFDITTGTPIYLYDVAKSINGASKTPTGGSIMAEGSNSYKFHTYDENGVSLGILNSVDSDGNPFRIHDGDMAGGCLSSEPVAEPGCNAYSMFYTNFKNQSKSDIFRLDLNNDNTLNKTLLATLNFGSVSSAVSHDGKLYVSSRFGNGYYVILDAGSGNQIGGTIAMTDESNNNIQEVGGSVFHNGLFYVTSLNGMVYALNPGTGHAVSTYTGISGQGSDILFDDNDHLWIIDRNTGTFYNLTASTSFTVPLTDIDGIALLANGNFAAANGDFGSLIYEIDPVAGELTGVSFETDITMQWGDLSGVCFDPFGFDVPEPGSCYATGVVEYVQGTSKNGGAIAANRTNANKALGAPERAGQLVFVSLGYGGSLILSFDGAISNGPGDDIEIVETSYGNPSCSAYPEFADVYVSVDGNSWHFAKTVCRTDGFVDISDAGAFPYVNFVKIVNNNSFSTTPDGFDVDGVVALHDCIDEDEGDVPPTNPFIAAESNSTITSYPNPTKGPSKVVFTTGQTTKTLVEVYDMNGRNVGTLFNQEAQKGKQYTLDFNGSTLSNGVYIYRMTTEKETIIEKFMIAK